MAIRWYDAQFICLVILKYDLYVLSENELNVGFVMERIEVKGFCKPGLGTQSTGSGTAFWLPDQKI